MTRSLPKILNILPLILNSIALIAVVWVIVPAPSASIWLLSVAAGEWSLWLGLAGSAGIVWALTARLFYGEGKIWLATTIVGSVVLVIALYPFFSVLRIAREQNISLSVSQYFFDALWNGNNDSKNINANAATYTFAQDEDGKDLRLDVYLPTSKSENNGASVIVVHGGSWNSGTRSDFPQWNRWLAAEGFTVFDIEYRLVQPNYLSATGDVKCAVRWIKNHAAEFGISPDRLAVLGRSAGAHLALLAAYSAGDARLPTNCEAAAPVENVRAVISFYAPIDLLWAFDNPANESVIDGPTTLGNFLGGNPHESDDIRLRYILASPIVHVSNNTPPTLLIHGGRDQLVREENMRFLAEKLENANVPHQTVFIPYAQHGFDYNFNGFGSQIVRPIILKFLNENTKTK